MFLISVHDEFQPAVSLGKWENAENYADNILEVRRQQILPKQWQTYTRLHGVTSQKRVMFRSSVR
jgi:hypothetical protein